MATTSSGDIFRYYNNEYQIAVNLHRECKLEAAEQKCRELEFNFECPRLIQVQACQLGSRCTSDYWRRKEHLEHGMFLLRQMDSRDQVVINSRQHTESMIVDLDEDWKRYWAARGLSAPTEEDVVEEHVMLPVATRTYREDPEQELGSRLQDLTI